MTTCATCTGALEPSWKFCIYCGTPAPRSAARAGAAPATRTQPYNRLAVLALVLACVGGAPALIFGHIAMRQIEESGERGMLMARIATALGYLWLAVLTVLVVFFILTNAA